MKTWIVAVLMLIALLPGAAAAATRSELLKQVEYSMLVKGTIETDAAGNVSSAAIEKPGKFPAGLVEYVQQQVAAWKFEPVLVNGQPKRARSNMSLLVVAKRLEKEGVTIRIRNASFDVEGLPGALHEQMLAPVKMTPPFYPESVAAAGVAGTAYVVVKVGKDGNVQDPARDGQGEGHGDLAERVRGRCTEGCQAVDVRAPRARPAGFGRVLERARAGRLQDARHRCGPLREMAGVYTGITADHSLVVRRRAQRFFGLFRR